MVLDGGAAGPLTGSAAYERALYLSGPSTRSQVRAAALVPTQPRMPRRSVGSRSQNGPDRPDDHINEEAAVSESTSGEGYVEAVDDEGTPDVGEDTSGAQYVNSAESGDPTAPEAGTGYASAVDDQGVPNAGEDTSGQGYVEGH